MSLKEGLESAAILLLYLLIPVILIIGEIKCIYKAIQCDWKPIGKAEIIYTSAAFTGFGCIVGYFEIEDE